VDPNLVNMTVQLLKSGRSVWLVWDKQGEDNPESQNYLCLNSTRTIISGDDKEFQKSILGAAGGYKGSEPKRNQKGWEQFWTPQLLIPQLAERIILLLDKKKPEERKLLKTSMSMFSMLSSHSSRTLLPEPRHPPPAPPPPPLSGTSATPLPGSAARSAGIISSFAMREVEEGATKVLGDDDADAAAIDDGSDPLLCTGRSDSSAPDVDSEAAAAAVKPMSDATRPQRSAPNVATPPSPASAPLFPPRKGNHGYDVSQMRMVLSMNDGAQRDKWLKTFNLVMEAVREDTPVRIQRRVQEYLMMKEKSRITYFHVRTYMLQEFDELVVSLNENIIQQMVKNHFSNSKNSST